MILTLTPIKSNGKSISAVNFRYVMEGNGLDQQDE